VGCGHQIQMLQNVVIFSQNDEALDDLRETLEALIPKHLARACELAIRSRAAHSQFAVYKGAALDGLNKL
jgi:hypothetical protein